MRSAIPAAACLVVLLHPDVAQAYVDPGPGSLIFQAVIATLLGLGLALRRRWRVLRGRLGRSKARPGETAGSDGRD